MNKVIVRKPTQAAEVARRTLMPAAPARLLFRKTSAIGKSVGEAVWPLSQPLDHESADVAMLLAQAMTFPSIPLPYRAELEARFAQPLAQIPVYVNPMAQQALALAHAEAITYQGAIFLADPHPSLSLIAHEVVHALQMQSAGTPDVNQQVVAANDPAEQEAITLADQVQRTTAAALTPPPVAVTTTLPATALALRRTTVPSPTDEPATTTFRRVVDQAPPPLPSHHTSEPAAAPPQAAAVPAPDLEPDQPPLALPPAPAPGIGDAEVAAQQAGMAEARAALTTATDPETLIATFAEASPTRKAQAVATLGTETDRLAKTEVAQLNAEVPVLHATLNPIVEEPPPLTVTPPDARSLELTVEGTLPRGELPPTPDPGRYTANDRLTTDISRLMSGSVEERAASIAEQLHEVHIHDSAVDTSPGVPPQIPLTDGADPNQIDTQIREGVTQSRQLRDDAAQAVINGPGPEQAQPIVLDEANPIGELAQPEIGTPSMPEGPQAYLEMGLPADVQAAFDQQQHRAMEANLIDAQQQMADAKAERERQQIAAVSEAQAQAQVQSEQADAQQRTSVIEARERIQGARQETLAAQHAAVADVEQQATSERTARRREIDERVRADESQIEQQYATAERDAQAEVADGERRAAAERDRAEREAEEQSWWSQAVSFVRDAFAALTRAIGAIFDALRRAVNAILDAAKAFATRLIDAAVAFINGLIAAFGAMLKGLIDTLIGSIFPELAARLNAAIDSAVAFAQNVVNTVAARLRAGIAALAEGLRAGLNAIINVYQTAITAALNVVQAVLSGDWAALARMVLEAVLRVAGIEPETFYQFIGRAQETFQIIIDNPGGFVGHLIDAFLNGVRNFAGNFLTHLQAGIIGWLTGALGGAGITLPERFDLMGVLSLIQQILGLTWDRLRERAVRLIGPQVVAVIEFVAGYLRTLIEGGWDALWQRIRDDLAGLRDMVLEGIKNFLLERVVMAAITRLATMFNPVGAIVNLILAAYNLFTFLRDQLSRIIEVVQTVVNAIGDIARGVIQPAAQRVEEILARLLPLAIDLLARLLGLGNVGSRVREIIERVRAVVDRAIDRLIERVRRLFRGEGTQAMGRREVSLARDTETTNASVGTVSNVKVRALNAIRQRIRNQRLQSLEEFQRVLTSVYQEFQPHGLRSLVVRIIDQTTMQAEIVATASPPERLSVAWRDLFGTQDDAIRLFAVQPRYETHAALSINGVRFGEVVVSNDQGHAEQNLLARYWASALHRAREHVASGTRTTVAIAINRAPCHNICTPALVAALNQVEPELKRRVRFILAPTGLYEPTERLTDVEIQEEVTRLSQLARTYGHSVKAILRERLSRVRYTSDTTTLNDLRRLVTAGWDIAQLQARAAPTQSGNILAEAAHKVMGEAQRLQASRA